jgi:excinuclease ABC subunit C
MEHLENIIQNLPKTPWVYQMKDKSGKVIYVGKAKNLKSRVSSYFLRTGDLSVAKYQMVGKIVDIETITCQTEVEALVLETNLIKHLSPKYNILMKDDKNLAYIKITDSPIPEVIKTRQKFADGGEYFGPYTSAVETSLRELKRIFRVRNCRVRFAQEDRRQKTEDTKEIVIVDKAGRTIPCIDYYIGICPWPCILEKEKIFLHEENVASLRNFLKWDTREVFEHLESDMKQKAKEMKFEEAAKIREILRALHILHERQSVRDIVDGDIDVFLLYEKYDKSYIWFTQIRWGQIVGVFRYEVKIGVDSYDDVLGQFLVDRYSSENLPKILLCSREIEDESIQEFLSGKSIAIEVPKIGPKKNLLDFTLQQVREYAYKNELATLENKTLNREHMANILTRLGYEVPKKWEIVFECYDISHTDGHFTYASRVVIVNGKPDPSRYKKYKIKTLQDGEIDDFASHREVMKRRTMEGIELENFPNLIIIDGGKGQLSSAMAGIREWYYLTPSPSPEGERNIGNPPSLKEKGQGDEVVPICSIAKREEEIFLPNKKDPILFEHWTSELMVLQKARDEAHRFSITANKSARMKSMKKNILEELPGIGPVTRKKLLKLAGSIEGIRDISSEELWKICTTAQIEVLRDHGII